MKFSDLDADDKYRVGEIIQTSKTEIVVEKFEWSPDNWATTGHAIVETGEAARGSDEELFLSSVNLNFRFDYPLKSIELKYGYHAGNVNIRINGQFLSAPSIALLDGADFAGASVAVVSSEDLSGFWGQMTLTGKITDFAIGGQELWLDDICTKD